MLHAPCRHSVAGSAQHGGVSRSFGSQRDPHRNGCRLVGRNPGPSGGQSEREHVRSESRLSTHDVITSIDDHLNRVKWFRRPRTFAGDPREHSERGTDRLGRCRVPATRDDNSTGDADG